MNPDNLMWEAVRQNRRRSTLLVSLMAIILIALGVAIGAYVHLGQGPFMGAGSASGQGSGAGALRGV